MIAIPRPRLRHLARRLVAAARAPVARWTRPAPLALALAATPGPRLPRETRELIRRMAGENRLRGADRIRGELLKLDIRVSKRTIQRYLRQARPPRPAGQTWSTVLRNHSPQIWACDFLQV